MEFNKVLKNIMKEAGITAGELAKRSGLSPSVISRYRSGERKPTADSENIKALASAIASYAAENNKKEITEAKLLERLLDTLGVTVIIDGATGAKKEKPVSDAYDPAPSADISGFLKDLDEFHLQKYLRVLKCDLNKYASEDPVKTRIRSTYAGLSGIRSGLCSLLKNSGDETFACYIDSLTGDLSAYPLDMRLKLEASILHSLQKGIKVTRIDTTAPGSEDSVRVLKDSLPFLMAGGYTLYHDETTHAAYPPSPALAALSDNTVLTAQAHGSDEDFYYALSSHDNAALTYQWNQFRDIMEKGTMTAQVYRKNDRTAYHRLLTTAELTRALSIRANTLPIATIPDTMLDTILARNGILGDKLIRIKNYVAYERRHFSEIADSVGIELSVPDPKSADFTLTPLSLGLSDMFEGGMYRYTFDEYRSHLSVTESFAKQHKKCRLTKEPAVGYPHLYISDIAEDLIMIAKDHAPASVLVIRGRLVCDLIRRA